MQRITVTVPDELAEAVRRAVERGEARSVSAYVTASIARHVQRESLIEVLYETYAESGSPSDADYERAARELGIEDWRTHVTANRRAAERSAG